MNALKKIFIGILIFLALVVIVSFFLPSKVRIDRSMVMNASSEIVFNQVNTLNNWEKWSVWDRIDSAMSKKYEGPESGANAKFSWYIKNDKVRKGSMTIKESIPFDSIRIELAFGEMTPSMAYFNFSKDEKGTKVNWSMVMDMGWNPFAKYAGLLMDKWIGPDFQNGLANMKEIVEKMPPPAKVPDDAMKIVTTTVPQQNLLMVHVKCHAKDMSKNIGESYQKIGAYAGKKGANMVGAPLAIYQHWDNDNFEFDAAIPFDKKLPGSGEVKSGEIKAGNVVMTNYYGAYEGAGKAHDLIKDWLKTNNKKMKGDAWEVYANDPMSEKDTAKWLTKIYYPVE